MTCTVTVPGWTYVEWTKLALLNQDRYEWGCVPLHEEQVLQSGVLVVSRQLSAQDQYKTANVTTTSMPTMLIHKQVYTHTLHAHTHTHALSVCMKSFKPQRQDINTHSHQSLQRSPPLDRRRIQRVTSPAHMYINTNCTTISISVQANTQLRVNCKAPFGQ